MEKEKEKEKEKLPPHPIKKPSISHSYSCQQQQQQQQQQVVVVEEEDSSISNNNHRFSHDVSRMPDFPTHNPGHRRAQSEILGLPDDLTFDAADLVGAVGHTAEGPSFSDDTEEDFLAMYLDMDKFAADADGAAASSSTTTATASAAALRSENEMPHPQRGRHHQHSQSMDGSVSIKMDDQPSSLAEAKKAMSAAKLADLALVDPKRAKRIWANRQSAARSKERKMRYIAELERKVQTLQTEATTLSAQLTMLQRDTNGLTAENNELKLRVQSMEQQVHLQDALNDALREEVQRLKMATGQIMANGPMLNYGPSSFRSNQQFYHHEQSMQSLLAAQQLQQLQIRPHSHAHQHQQPPADIRLRGPSMAPQNQRENTANSGTNAPME